MLLWQATNHNSSCSSHTMLHHTPKAYGSLGCDESSHQKKATVTKTNGAHLLKWLAALCVLNSVGAATVPPVTTFDFDFSDGIAASLGWSTGGGDPTTYAFKSPRCKSNACNTPSSNTGPSAGVGGSGSYVYAETSSPRAQGDLFTLAYDGSACSDTGLGVSTVFFHYHMYGATMGELRVINAAGEEVWSLNGNKGNSWQAATVDVYSPSFAYEYTRGNGWQGDAAVAQVTVSCGSEIHSGFEKKT